MTSEMIFMLLQMCLQLLSAINLPSRFETVVNAIKTYLPVIEKAEPEIAAQFYTIIGDLTQNPNLTTAQVSDMLSAKATLDARTDADIAAVAAEYAAAHPGSTT